MAHVSFCGMIYYMLASSGFFVNRKIALFVDIPGIR